ncbi:MAG: ATP-grasp domain-containing protein [Gammaproteobacteria bacterium]|nr:ATP-grasp domain-containing protein [Gammaproteobacteria bacterium]
MYTSPPENEYVSIPTDLFEKIFFFEDFDAQEQVIAALSEEGFERIYYGSESSVALTDELALALTPAYANPLLSAAARSDKFAMQIALKEHHLSHIRQMKVQRSLTEAQALELKKWTFPLIVKPLNSAASIGVQRCRDLQELIDYFEDAIHVNIFGGSVTEFVVQQWLAGDEYFIDTFSINGVHYLSGIQKYQKLQNVAYPVALYSEVIALDSEIAATLTQYCFQVLNAVDFKNGLAHVEVMVTDHGPYLIEINPRISGARGMNNKLFEYCGFASQVRLLAHSCMQKGSHVAVPETSRRYGRKIYLQNYVVPRLIGALNLDLLQSLPSFQEGLMLKKPGTLCAHEPKNLTDAIALVLIAHADPVQIEMDYQKILAWEKSTELF